MQVKLVNGVTKILLTKREKSIIGDAQALCRALAPMCLTATEAADRLRDVRAWFDTDGIGSSRNAADATEATATKDTK